MRAYSQKTFSAMIGTDQINFFCETHNTRNGFCHVCYCPIQEDYSSKPSTTRISYLNRTWESFQYESVLRKAIDKFPKDVREDLTAQLIERTRKAEHERCERQIEQFKALHAGLTDRQKQLLAEQPPMQTEEDMHRTMGMMAIFNLLNA